jgi:L-Ala-D/L-Glu epimerase
MNRRDWLKVAGALSAACVLPGAEALAALSNESSSSCSLETSIVRLKLRHTWTTTMSSSEYRDTLQVQLASAGVTGVGEGAPIVRYHEDAAASRKTVESLQPLLTSANPWHFEKLMTEVSRRVDGQFAAKAAIDIALMDWVGKKLNVPLYRYLGLDPADAPVTTFSIGIDTPEITKQKVREAEDFPVLKIKVGLSTDEPTIEAVRSVTKKPLRVDANEGWKDKEMLQETRWVRSRVHIPVIADEACLNTRAIPKLVDAYDGVNVKLDKCGGVQEALRMIYMAKALGMKTMLGCMVSSSVSVTAAAHLSPLVDYADLDGNLLIANDPYLGVLVNKGKLMLPDRPGLGLTPA